MPLFIAQVSLRVAWRNIAGNARRSIIIIVLETAIVALFFLGNSILSESGQGLKEGFRESFTGDAYIRVAEEVPVSLFGVITPSIGEYHTIKDIPEFDTVRDIVENQAGVSATTPLLSGYLQMKVGKRERLVAVFGVDWDSYNLFFPHLSFSNGAFPKTDETGILISQGLFESLGQDRSIGDFFSFFVAGSGGFRIRELPLKGIVDYAGANKGMDEVVIIDAQSLRDLMAAHTEELFNNDQHSEESDLLSLDLDSLFDESELDSFPNDRESENIDVIESVKENTGTSFGDLLAGFSNAPAPSFIVGDIQELAIADGPWHFLLIRFSEGVSPRSLIKILEARLTNDGLIVAGWRDAAGLSVLLINLLKVIFNGGGLLVMIAGVVAIVNLLVVSVIERTGEIGTLRAIGASKSYLRRLLLTEYLTLSGIAGLLGVSAGAGVLTASNNARISLENSLLRSLFGSTELFVSFSWSSALIAMATAFILGGISSLFPLAYALEIQPARAVSQE